MDVGVDDGTSDGDPDGLKEGTVVGTALGTGVDGIDDGVHDGIWEGVDEWNFVGDCDGMSVQASTGDGAADLTKGDSVRPVVTPSPPNDGLSGNLSPPGEASFVPSSPLNWRGGVNTCALLNDLPCM